MYMNLFAAQQSIHSKPLRVTAWALALEAAVVVSVSYMLVGIFA